MPRMSENMRRHPRRAIGVDFRARDLQGAGQLLFEAVDVSAGGAFLRSDLLLEEGEPLVLEFRVPGVPRLIRAQGRIAWVRRFPAAGEPGGMGVQFLQLADDDRRLLSDFLGGGAT